jgi:Sec-independent protein translocase protein TatA
VPFLSPAKLLVVVVVAVVVLGPDELPKVAHQFGSLWSDLRRLRARLETDVRGSFPDLPSTEKLQQAVRSPLSFLDDLADANAPDEGVHPPALILAVAGGLGALHRQPSVAAAPDDILAVADRLGTLHRTVAERQTYAEHTLRSTIPAGADVASLN